MKETRVVDKRLLEGVITMARSDGKSIDGFELHLRFPVRISVFASATALALDALYYYFSRSATETLVFAAATTAAAGAILAAFYTGRALGLQITAGIETAANANNEYILEKKKVALTLAARWNAPSMLTCRRTCREIVNMKTHGLEQLREAINRDANLDDIIHLLNFLEEVAIAGNEDVADEVLLKDFFGVIVAHVWRTLELWIQDYRNTRGAPRIWGELESTRIKWVT